MSFWEILKAAGIPALLLGVVITTWVQIRAVKRGVEFCRELLLPKADQPAVVLNRGDPAELFRVQPLAGQFQRLVVRKALGERRDLRPVLAFGKHRRFIE